MRNDNKTLLLLVISFGYFPGHVASDCINAQRLISSGRALGAIFFFLVTVLLTGHFVSKLLFAPMTPQWNLYMMVPATNILLIGFLLRIKQRMDGQRIHLESIPLMDKCLV